MTMNFGADKIYYGVMYSKYLKHNLPQATGTLFLANADKDNKQKRKWHQLGLCNVYCKACDRLMVIPYADEQTLKAKSFTCPSCGRTHQLDNIVIAKNENSLLPCFMNVKLLAKKETIELVVKYDGIIMGRNVYDDFLQVDNVKETYVFDTNRNDVVWRKFIDGQLEEVMALGYLSDLKDFEEKSALYWLNSNYKDKEGRAFCELLKTLRDEINARMKKQGLSKRNMYVNGSQQYKAVDNVLHIAHQVRFWDGKANNAYGNGKNKLDEWKLRYMVDINIEKRTELLMKEGKTYVEALIEALELPNTKNVRKNICLENAYVLQQAYSIKGVETYLFKTFKEWLRKAETTKKAYPYQNLIGKAYEEIIDTCKFLKTFRQHYLHVPIEKMVQLANERNGRDIMCLWNSADRESRKIFQENMPKFKELHDYLSLLVAKQKDRELDFEIPEHIVRRMDMYLKNINCKVLEKFSQVKQASIDLKNCASGYRNKINENLQLVLMSDDNGKPVALLEISNNNIVQAKLFANVSVKNDVKVNNAVIEFAQKAKLGIKTGDVVLFDEEERKTIFKVA